MYLNKVMIRPGDDRDFAGIADILGPLLQSNSGVVAAAQTAGNNSGGWLNSILRGLNSVGTIGATYYQNVGRVNYAKYGANQAESGIYPSVSNQTPAQAFEQIGPYLLGGAGLIALSMILSKGK